MKLYRSLLPLALAGLLVVTGSVGCDSLVEGYEQDPNAPTEAPPTLILTGAQVGGILFNEGDLARTAGIWADQFTGADRQYLSLNVYTVTASDHDNMWNLAYANTISQTRLVREAATETNNRLLRGIAAVTEAQTFGMLTALFGDVPYNQASQPEAYPDPAFDPQEHIYAGVQQMLSEAIADFESGAGVSPGSADIYYGGDVDRWLGAAHTLKARFFMHTGGYEQAITHARQGIASPAGDMISPHGGGYQTDMNPYYMFVEMERSGYMTAEGALAPRLLDPASAAYRGNAKTNEAARFAHFYAGAGPDYALATDGACAFGRSSDFPQVTYLENQLILAEALLLARGDFAGALAALNTARAALDDQFGPGLYQAYEAADFDAGGIASVQGASPANALLREILEEKYLSLIGQLEPFNDARRTDNFLGIPIKHGTRFPQRFLIAQDEITSNENAPDPPPGLFEETWANARIHYAGVN